MTSSHESNIITVATLTGEARATLTMPDRAQAPIAALALGHGAGGGIGAPDLLTARRVALAAGLCVALVEQPYRVAGRRSAPAAPRLDEAWIAVLEDLRDRGLAPTFVVGGRSSGARVACRTAAITGAIGVLCLAFPLQPPARAGSEHRAPSRQPELDAVTVPTLVVQGVNDRFGMPGPGARRTVVQVPGDHGLKRAQPVIAVAIASWLDDLSLRR